MSRREPTQSHRIARNFSHDQRYKVAKPLRLLCITAWARINGGKTWYNVTHVVNFEDLNAVSFALDVFEPSVRHTGNYTFIRSTLRSLFNGNFRL